MNTNIITNNLLAMNANRMLGINTKRKAKSSEKLSSGYRVNRAADDAASLAISEKMRRQVRGLNQSAQNIQDGVSLCQVADGALNETADILQRMRELAVKAANGTNSESDRHSIEMEIAHLRNEINRIAMETEFNDDIYPLNASATYIPGSNDPIFPDVPDVPDISVPEYEPDEGLIKEMTITFVTDRACTYDGKQYQPGDTMTVTGLTTNGTEVWINGGLIHPPGSWSTDPSDTQFSSNMGTLKKADLKIDGDGYLYYVHASGVAMYASYTYPERLSPMDPDPMYFLPKSDADEAVRIGYGRYMTVDDLTDQEPDPSDPDPPKPSDPDSPATYVPVYSGKPISIQSGAEAGQHIPIYLVNATCEGLGITGVTVSMEDSAAEAMELLSNAINRVSEYRSAFGATQNRLEYAYNINLNSAENTQYAESVIRDADIAKLMVEYANENILEQTSTSMLAQANQQPGMVMQLLQ